MPFLFKMIILSLYLYWLRPGLIGPHSISGHANPQDWVCWLVRGLARLKQYPEGPGCNEVIHFIPVDYVAKAVVYFSMEAHRRHRGTVGVLVLSISTWAYDCCFYSKWQTSFMWWMIRIQYHLQNWLQNWRNCLSPRWSHAVSTLVQYL